MSYSIYSNSCIYCNAQIPDKTKSGKARKFCNKSCSRKWVCQNKPEVVHEANKRGYQTLLKREDAKDFIKYRGRKTVKKAEKLKEMAENGHFHRMNASVISPQTSPESQAKRKATMIERGFFLDYDSIDVEKWENYSKLVRKMTRDLYGSGKNGFEIDHIVPVSYGFLNDIPPDKIYSSENIQLISISENRSKGTRLTERAIELLDIWSTT